MDDETVFKRLAKGLFATNIRPENRVRLIGFRLGQLEILPLGRRRCLRKNNSLELVHAGERFPELKETIWNSDTSDGLVQ